MFSLTRRAALAGGFVAALALWAGGNAPAARAAEVAWEPTYAAALAKAKASKKLIMVDFFTEW